jgi:SLAP domain-containing protein
MKTTTTIDINSDQLKVVKQDGYFLVSFDEKVEQYYTSTEAGNTLSLDIPKFLGTVSGVEQQLETVINQPLDNLSIKQDITSPAKISLTIEKIEENKMTLSLLIMNNMDAPISLQNVPYKIINSEGSEVYKGTLVDGPFEANSQTYSRYIFNIEEEVNFNIKLEDYEIVFSH